MDECIYSSGSIVPDNIPCVDSSEDAGYISSTSTAMAIFDPEFLLAYEAIQMSMVTVVSLVFFVYFLLSRKGKR